MSSQSSADASTAWDNLKSLIAERDQQAQTIADLVAALRDAERLVQTARQYFPKSVKDSDRFQLEQTCASISAALERATDTMGD